MSARASREWQVAPDGIHIILVDTESGDVLERPKTRYGTQARAKEAAAWANRQARELDEQVARLTKENAERIRGMRIRPNDTYPETQLDLVIDTGWNMSRTITLNQHELRHLARVIADWHVAEAKERRRKR